jgi:hypothetical protein
MKTTLLPRLLALGILLSLPLASHADIVGKASNLALGGKEKPKKGGETPPRPTPPAGPREDGDDD